MGSDGSFAEYTGVVCGAICEDKVASFFANGLPFSVRLQLTNPPIKTATEITLEVRVDQRFLDRIGLEFGSAEALTLHLKDSKDLNRGGNRRDRGASIPDKC